MNFALRRVEDVQGAEGYRNSNYYWIKRENIYLQCASNFWKEVFVISLFSAPNLTALSKITTTSERFRILHNHGQTKDFWTNIQVSQRATQTARKRFLHPMNSLWGQAIILGLFLIPPALHPRIFTVPIILKDSIIRRRLRVLITEKCAVCHFGKCERGCANATPENKSACLTDWRSGCRGCKLLKHRRIPSRACTHTYTQRHTHPPHRL